MPKIAELREIDGALWARVEMLEPQPVSLLTSAEVDAIRKDERMACIWAVDNCPLLTEEERSIAVQAIKGFTIIGGAAP